MCNEEENGDYREEDEEVEENNPHLMPERDANGNIIVRPYGRVYVTILCFSFNTYVSYNIYLIFCFFK